MALSIAWLYSLPKTTSFEMMNPTESPMAAAGGSSPRLVSKSRRKCENQRKKEEKGRAARRN